MTNDPIMQAAERLRRAEDLEDAAAVYEGTPFNPGDDQSTLAGLALKLLPKGKRPVASSSAAITCLTQSTLKSFRQSTCRSLFWSSRTGGRAGCQRGGCSGRDCGRKSPERRVSHTRVNFWTEPEPAAASVNEGREG